MGFKSDHELSLFLLDWSVICATFAFSTKLPNMFVVGRDMQIHKVAQATAP